MVYRQKNSDNDQLKHVDYWAQLSQDTLNQATDQLPKRLTWLSKSMVLMLNYAWTNRVCK